MDLKEPNSGEIYELLMAEGLCQLSQFSGYHDGKSLEYCFLQQLASVRTGRIIRR